MHRKQYRTRLIPRRFIAAMGGELRIIAHFPQGDVEITQFDDIRKQEPAETTTD